MSSSTPGWFGAYGGRFVAETLVAALDELDAAWRDARESPSFRADLEALLTSYVGRPTPLYRADRLSAEVARAADRSAGSVRIWLKREDLAHTGAHKINNTMGQVLLAHRMGKPRVIAETGAGQHGVATATACALFGIRCEVFMGELDVARQAPNVLRMELLGAKVHPVRSGSRTLKDAMNEALRDWVTHVQTTHYCVGSVAGPHPYPSIVRELQSVIGREARAQLAERTSRLPDVAVACVGGGSNAMGLFAELVDDERARDVLLFGIEAAGDGIDTERHAATLSRGSVGVLHGAKSYVLQDDHGQILEAHSVSAGLDYPGVGPEHSHLRDSGRARYLAITDAEALAGFASLARTEGILCALETSHAIAALPRVVREVPDREGGIDVLVCLSGRGDKDLATVRAWRDQHESGS